VAVSILHAIVSGEEAEIIKHLTEVNIHIPKKTKTIISLQIYFTCLYWVSIIWIIFCMVDIIQHRKRVKVPTDSNRPNSILPTSSEVNRKSSITPKINLQLFDDLNEDQSDESEHSETSNTKPSTDNYDAHHKKSNSLNNLAHQSSVTKSPTNTTGEVFTRYDDQLSKFDFFYIWLVIL
jgi:hypothetical protein